jgi:uncharacterized lipoprotein
MKQLIYQAIAIIALAGCSQIKTTKRLLTKMQYLKDFRSKSEQIVANLRYSGTIEPRKQFR